LENPLAIKTYRQQWSNLARSAITVAAVFIIIAGLRAAAEILSPLLLAIFFTALIYPTLEWLMKKVE
jgi:predicted PurR-regulated permease PerM